MKKGIIRLGIYATVAIGIICIIASCHPKKAATVPIEAAAATKVKHFPEWVIKSNYTDPVKYQISAYEALCCQDEAAADSTYDTLVANILKHVKTMTLDKIDIGDIAYAYQLRAFYFNEEHTAEMMKSILPLLEQRVHGIEQQASRVKNKERKADLADDASFERVAILNLRGGILYGGFRGQYNAQIDKWDHQLIAYENRLYTVIKKLGAAGV